MLIKMTNNCDSRKRSAQARNLFTSMIYLICDDLMHVMYNIAFTAKDVATKILTFLEANHLEFQ